MYVAYYSNPLGLARITEEEGFITSISIKDDDHSTSDATEITPVLQQAISQLDEYFAGKRLVFDFPIKQAGTDFQQTVWQQLQTIAYGKTISYGKMSEQMGNPLAIRAIAAANGKNNLWVVVPCHRVIGADGTLTGYAGGLWRKQWLLEHEAKVAGTGQVRLF
jgi:methylated-DNA-[protein]-cysteine S-methyltransferase